MNFGYSTESIMHDLKRENAKLKEEVKRWFKYVDPCDMYPEDREAYDKRWKSEQKEDL